MQFAVTSIEHSTFQGETTTPKDLEIYYKKSDYYKALDESLPRMHRLQSRIINPLTRVYPQNTLSQIKILLRRQWHQTFAQVRYIPIRFRRAFDHNT